MHSAHAQSNAQGFWPPTLGSAGSCWVAGDWPGLSSRELGPGVGRAGHLRLLYHKLPWQTRCSQHSLGMGSTCKLRGPAGHIQSDSL